MELPSLVKTYWYAFDWDVEALWALDLPVTRMPISRLEWHLDMPTYPFEGRAYTITPRDVVRWPNRYAEEYARTQRADLIFPIEITWHRGRWVILDGVHRLIKAHELGLTEMQVRKVPRRFLLPLERADPTPPT